MILVAVVITVQVVFDLALLMMIGAILEHCNPPAKKRDDDSLR